MHSLHRQNEALLHLAASDALQKGEMEEALCTITEIAAAVLEVEHASVWLYNEGKSVLRRVDRYERATVRHVSGSALTVRDFPAYFAALRAERIIAATDIAEDPRTREFAPVLQPLGISSILDARIWLEGEIVGVLCHEHEGEPRRWTAEEQNFATSVADMISMALGARQRLHAEQALLRVREQHDALLSNIPDMAWVKDLEGRYLAVNDAFVRALHQRADTRLRLPAREDVTGRTDRELFPEAVAEAARREDRWVLGTGERLAVEVSVRMEDGALAWYETVKTPFRDDTGTYAGTVGVSRDITARKLTELALKASEERYRTLFEISSDAICFTTPDGWYLDANPAFLKLVGWTRDELKGMNAHDLYVDGFAREELLRRVEVAGSVRDFEAKLVRSDGRTLDCLVTTSVWRGEDGEAIGYQGVMRDLTEQRRLQEAQRRLEEELRQAQKMEAVGRLAGGVAHDFNNLLQVISGNAELLLDDLPPGDPMREDVQEIAHAGSRAASLTRQLLAFSRKQVIKPRTLNLNEQVSHMEKMLRRVIGEDVRMETILDPALGNVLADPGQVEQVILNLVLNARDAMPGGGELVIRTRNADMPSAEPAGKAHAAAPRPGVLLSVSDTGEGMSREVLERIFEPFFTTKEQGKGTGLGLSTVYGIVRQSGGNVWVYSEPGEGSTFKVFLPRVEETVPVEAAAEPWTAPRASAGTILVVEDEKVVRGLIEKVLVQSGYTVICERTGERAIRVAQEHAGRIDLLLSDIVMPGMSGIELAKRLGESQPELRVVLMSGYSEDAIGRHGVLNDGTHFLEKPFSPNALRRQVTAALTAAGVGAAS